MVRFSVCVAECIEVCAGDGRREGGGESFSVVEWSEYSSDGIEVRKEERLEVEECIDWTEALCDCSYKYTHLVTYPAVGVEEEREAGVGRDGGGDEGEHVCEGS